MKERLTAETIAKARAVAAAASAGASAPSALVGVLSGLGGQELDAITQLRRFFTITHVLTLDADVCELSDAETTRLGELATNILKLEHVRPRSSRFSHLHAELALATAHGHLARGRSFQALGALQAAKSLATRGADADVLARITLHTARVLLRLGKAGLAETGLALPLMDGLPAGERATQWETALRLLRWGGRDAEFASLAEVYARTAPADGSREARVLAWERLAAAAAASGDLNAMARATSRNGPLAEAAYALKALLWSFALPTVTVPRGFVSVESLRRHYGLSLRNADPTTRLLGLVKALEDCRDNQAPLEHRLALLDDAAAKLATHPDPEVLLLGTAAMARWLKTANQPMRAAVLAEDHRRFARALSNERHHDPLGLGATLKIDAWERFTAPVDDDALPAAQATAPTSAAGRALELTRIGLGALPKLLKRRFAGAFVDKADARALGQAQSAEVVAYLVQRIGALKGPIVKIAQMTSVIHAALPEEVYQAVVGLRESGPGMAGAVARRIVMDELGKDVFQTKLFDFDDEPLAAASVGQIHRARTADGADVVVKVQYPGLREMVRSDIALLKLLVLPIYRVLFPAVDLKAIADAVERLVLNECDFHLEAEAQERARARLAGVAGVKVPRVYKELSTGSVLTMERAVGRRFSAFVAEASPELRSAVGARLAATMVSDYFAGETFNADPHPGNFLFADDGTVTLLDFGAMGAMPRDRLATVRALMLAARDQDLAGFQAALTALGYVGDASFDFQAELDTARLLLAPVLTGGRFRFTYAFFNDVFAHYGLASKNRKRVRFDAGDVPMWRFLIGLQVLLCELEAEADWGAIFWTAAGRAAGGSSPAGL